MAYMGLTRNVTSIYDILLLQMHGQGMTFYMYRAQSDYCYPMSNVNLGFSPLSAFFARGRCRQVAI